MSSTSQLSPPPATAMLDMRQELDVLQDTQASSSSKPEPEALQQLQESSGKLDKGHLGEPPYFWDHSDLFVSPDKREDPHCSEKEHFEKSFPLESSLFPQLQFNGDWSSLNGVLSKLVRGSPVRVAIIGGSIPMGNECVMSLGMHGVPEYTSGLYKCAWLVRLVAWMRSFSKSEIDVVNFCQRAQTSCQHMQRVDKEWNKKAAGPVDLVFLDTFGNDMKADVLCYEILVRMIFELSATAVPFAVLLGNPRHQKLDRLDIIGKTRHAHEAILSHYNIPTVDVMSLMLEHPWLWDTNESINLGMFSHPSWRSDQLIADMLANMLARHWAACCLDTAMRPKNVERAALRAPFHDQKALEAKLPCRETLKTWNSFSPTDKAAITNITGNWRVYEDRPTKPGWIATEADSTISFPVLFSKKPVLTITYMRSYENMGDAWLSFGSDPQKQTLLRGLWDGDLGDVTNKVSQAHQEIIKPEMSGPGKDVATIRAIPGRSWKGKGPWVKFKIMQVTSC
eukprot:TRINITY_DN9463_c0_g5_i1.p1 TRINITY_DN9463_c0_g5~~TRINITY_DN9463_c0_g5_i1.p1  ORF type:complete len:568 (-),score=99.41 TRINITY_DN9463_c0_g5_i1:56-1582(-)